MYVVLASHGNLIWSTLFLLLYCDKQFSYYVLSQLDVQCNVWVQASIKSFENCWAAECYREVLCWSTGSQQTLNRGGVCRNRLAFFIPGTFKPVLHKWGHCLPFSKEQSVFSVHVCMRVWVPAAFFLSERVECYAATPSHKSVSRWACKCQANNTQVDIWRKGVHPWEVFSHLKLSFRMKKCLLLMLKVRCAFPLYPNVVVKNWSFLICLSIELLLILYSLHLFNHP